MLMMFYNILFVLSYKCDTYSFEKLSLYVSLYVSFVKIIFVTSNDTHSGFRIVSLQFSCTFFKDFNVRLT